MRWQRAGNRVSFATTTQTATRRREAVLCFMRVVAPVIFRQLPWTYSGKLAPASAASAFSFAPTISSHSMMASSAKNAG